MFWASFFEELDMKLNQLPVLPNDYLEDKVGSLEVAVNRLAHDMFDMKERNNLK